MKLTIRGFDSSDETIKLAQSEFENLSGMGNFKVSFELADTDGYSLLHEDGILKFFASSQIEILYAVYDFAETFMGYCFFEPGVDLKSGQYEAIPTGLLFDKKLHKLKRRGFIQEFPFNEDSFLLADWMAKNRLNYLMIWMKYYDLISDELKKYFAVRGIEIESGHHNFSYWIPASEYGEKHPEFFAMKDGVRIKPSVGKDVLLLSEQLCTTNPELKAEMARKMIAYAKCHPEIKTLSISPNDGFGWCECPECSKFYDADDMGEFYCVSEHTYRAGRIYHEMFADVAGQFHVECPDVNVTFMAYVNYDRPSSGFKLKPGEVVYFAPYWRCINHLITDATCPVNRYYLRDILEWCACREGGEINIYEYFMGVNFYLSLPMLHHELIFDEIDFYHQNEVEGLLTQFHLPHWGVYGLNYYAMAQAGYGADKEQFQTKTFSALFGSHAAQYRKFYTELRSLQESVGKCLLPYPRHLFSRTEIVQFDRLVESAAALPEDIPYPVMCERLKIWMQYLRKFKDLSDAANAGTLTIRGVELFSAWCHAQEGKRIIVLDRLDKYLTALTDCLKSGREWIHFNIDWEDEHIKRMDEYLALES